MTIRLVAAAAALVFGVATVAAPAMAAPRTVPAPASAPVTAAPVDSAAAGELATRALDPSTRFCVVGKVTGSLIPRRECHTRQQWLDAGYDPFDDLRRR